MIGNPIDGKGPINSKDYASIHSSPPNLASLSTKTEILVTGIKVIDLLAPYIKGGKIGLLVAQE